MDPGATHERAAARGGERDVETAAQRAVGRWRGCSTITDETRGPAVQGEIPLLMDPIGIWVPAPQCSCHAAAAQSLLK